MLKKKNLYIIGDYIKSMDTKTDLIRIYFSIENVICMCTYTMIQTHIFNQQST